MQVYKYLCVSDCAFVIVRWRAVCVCLLCLLLQVLMGLGTPEADVYYLKKGIEEGMAVR